MSEPDLRELLESKKRGVLATLLADGRPHLANVLYVIDEDRRLLLSTPGRSVKAKNLKRDPRASLNVSRDDFFAFVVAEGTADLTVPATDPGDATSDALVDYYRRAQGEHPNWDEYRAAMVEEGRVLVRLSVERLYGMV